MEMLEFEVSATFAGGGEAFDSERHSLRLKHIFAADVG
jgi:hypothetical protein